MNAQSSTLTNSQKFIELDKNISKNVENLYDIINYLIPTDNSRTLNPITAEYTHSLKSTGN